MLNLEPGFAVVPDSGIDDIQDVCADVVQNGTIYKTVEEAKRYRKEFASDDEKYIVVKVTVEEVEGD